MSHLPKKSFLDGADPAPKSGKESQRSFEFYALSISLAVGSIAGVTTVAIAIGDFLFFLVLSLFYFNDHGMENERIRILETIGRAQQAHWSETKSFAPSIASLDLSVAGTTDLHDFVMEGEGDRRFYSVDAVKSRRRSFVGAVFVVEPFTNPTDPSAAMIETVTIVCGEKWGDHMDTTTIKHLKPSLEGDTPVCHPDTEMKSRSFPMNNTMM